MKTKQVQTVLKPHLFVKRFSNDTKEVKFSKGCLENRKSMPWDAQVDRAGRASKCHVCRETVPKNEARFALALQCHKGWKFKAFLHLNCIAGHPESRKIDLEEVDSLNSGQLSKVEVETVAMMLRQARSSVEGDEQVSRQVKDESSVGSKLNVDSPDTNCNDANDTKLESIASPSSKKRKKGDAKDELVPNKKIS